MAEPPMFTVNPKRVPKEQKSNNFIKNEQFSLWFRNTVFKLDLYIFDNNQNPIRRQIDVRFLPEGIDRFFQQKVFPELKINPAKSPTIHISESAFAEILYRRLWPISEKDLYDFFDSPAIQLEIGH